MLGSQPIFDCSRCLYSVGPSDAGSCTCVFYNVSRYHYALDMCNYTLSLRSRKHIVTYLCILVFLELPDY
jgi:hypothetical protein